VGLRLREGTRMNAHPLLRDNELLVQVFGLGADIPSGASSDILPLTYDIEEATDVNSAPLPESDQEFRFFAFHSLKDPSLFPNLGMTPSNEERRAYK
jgi:hypothetical protein